MARSINTLIGGNLGPALALSLLVLTICALSHFEPTKQTGNQNGRNAHDFPFEFLRTMSALIATNRPGIVNYLGMTSKQKKEHSLMQKTRYKALRMMACYTRKHKILALKDIQKAVPQYLLNPEKDGMKGVLDSCNEFTDDQMENLTGIKEMIIQMSEYEKKVRPFLPVRRPTAVTEAI